MEVVFADNVMGTTVTLALAVAGGEVDPVAVAA
jgi:hypothetical protein